MLCHQVSILLLRYYCGYKCILFWQPLSEADLELPAVNYYQKALHLGCCSSPRSASDCIHRVFTLRRCSSNRFTLDVVSSIGNCSRVLLEFEIRFLACISADSQSFDNSLYKLMASSSVSTESIIPSMYADFSAVFSACGNSISLLNPKAIY